MTKRKEKMTMAIMYKKEEGEEDRRVRQMLMSIKANYSDIIREVN